MLHSSTLLLYGRIIPFEINNILLLGPKILIILMIDIFWLVNKRILLISLFGTHNLIIIGADDI